MHLLNLRRTARAFAATACFVAPFVASAQSAVGSPWSLGVQGGATIPTGDFSDATNTGWNIGGYLQARPANQVFGIRGEVQYNRNNLKDEFIFEEGGDPLTTGRISVLYGGLDGVLEVAPSAGGVGWYLLAGPGLYHEQETISEQGIDRSVSDTKVGFNVGGGLKFRMGGTALFVESRYHTFKVGSSTFSYFPISAGLSWGR